MGNTKRNIAFLITVVITVTIFFTEITGKKIQCSSSRDFNKGICVVLSDEHFANYSLSGSQLYVFYASQNLIFNGYSIAWNYRFFRPDSRKQLSVSKNIWTKLSSVLENPLVLSEELGDESYYLIANSQFPIIMLCRNLPPNSTNCDINVEVGESYLVKFSGLSIDEPINVDELLAEMVRFQQKFTDPFDYVLLY